MFPEKAPTPPNGDADENAFSIAYDAAKGRAVRSNRCSDLRFRPTVDRPNLGLGARDSVTRHGYTPSPRMAATGR
jgi:hypothetical protein